jgi:hypothetical protein
MMVSYRMSRQHVWHWHAATLRGRGLVLGLIGVILLVSLLPCHVPHHRLDGPIVVTTEANTQSPAPIAPLANLDLHCMLAHAVLLPAGGVAILLLVLPLLLLPSTSLAAMTYRPLVPPPQFR